MRVGGNKKHVKVLHFGPQGLRYPTQHTCCTYPQKCPEYLIFDQIFDFLCPSLLVCMLNKVAQGGFPALLVELVGGYGVHHATLP